DTGKLTHTGALSLVDLNRAGVPLMEIVSEPDMRSVEEARAYAEKIRHILRYLGVNSGDMEKGVIRFEANVSIRPVGDEQLYTRTEIKNLNSFRALVRSIEYEIARQIATVELGGAVEQETLGWSEEREQIYVQRSKESAHDYRYFPEPDLLPLEISPQRVEAIRARLPELPDARRERFAREYGLSRYQAALLTEERAVADYFESGARQRPAAGFAALANWMCGDLFRLMNESGQEIGQVKIAPVGLVELAGLVESGVINLNTARAVFEEAFTSGRSPRAIVADKGLAQLSDTSALEALVKQVLDENPTQVEQYLGGKAGLANWLLGQVMKTTRGQANPQIVQSLLKTALDERRTL
ncbi:MAG: Asp-tRNA(Asn)/Glu-tRNA(Gln) amidotransferase subunit GatB, partial [Thermoflexales bacterium]|nr:Asp-tRNA(Asn)/Glu-tRNA(Gln) amidotransferase subunit GatB [Thermoflexales bacterium]